MKKIITLTLTLALSITTVVLPFNAKAEDGEYVESFKASDKFSTTSNAGPWYYYMQRSDTNAISRMIGSNSGLNVGTNIINADIENKQAYTVRTGKIGVDTSALSPAGAFPLTSTANEADKSNFGYIGPNFMSPEERWNWTSPTETIQVMRAFEVPYDCTAVISADTEKLTGMVSRANKSLGDRRVRIMKNNPSNEAENVSENKLWPKDKDWEQINGVESINFPDLDPISLKQGDMLFFVVDNNGTRFNDDVMWDPIINMVSKDELGTLIDDNFDNSMASKNIQTVQGFTFADGVAKATGTDCQLIYGNQNWTEYKIDVDVVAHQTGSLTWKIRRKDNSNNYNFALTNTGTLNLRRNVSGANATVAQGNFGTNAFPYRGNVLPAELLSYPSSYKLSVYVRDNLVRIYIDGAIVASYKDPDGNFLSGDVVIGSYGQNSGIQYDNIKISARVVDTVVGPVTITDADNNPVDDLSGVSVVRVKANVENVYSEPSRYMVIIAVYDEFDRMIGISCGTPNYTKVGGAVWTDSVGSTYTATLDYDISTLSDKSYVKGLLWYDLNNTVPQQISATTKK